MKPLFSLRLAPAARACLLSLLLPLAARAAVTTTGASYGSSNNNTWVGYSGTGTLLINGGSGYTALTLSVGQLAGDNGTITVTGSGSTLTTTQSVFLGSSGVGTLNILDGGVVTSNGAPTSYGIEIGDNSGSSGSVLVDGAGSQWYVASLNTGVGVFAGSSGSLTIQNGGNVTFGTGSLNIYNGTLLVTGAGSMLNTLSSVQFNLGSAAGTTATISDGGVFNSAGNNAIGYFKGYTATMTLTGEGSQWNVVGNLYVGASSGTGTLTVADGAVVSVSTSGSANADGTGFASIAGDGILYLGYQAQSSNAGTPGSTGTLYIGTGGAAGKLNVAEVFGYYATGSVAYPPAVATLVFNHNETDYEFTNASGAGIVIAGTTNVINQAGVTVLTATNTYFGSTTVAGGTLVVNGSIAGGSLTTVKSGGALGGSGTVGGATTVQSGGRLTPGALSPSTLTFANGLALDDGAILDFKLGASSDKIVVSGGVLSSTGYITVNLIDSGGFAAGDYTLVDASGATLSGIDASDFVIGTSIDGYTYAFSLDGNTVTLTATAIPEPAACAALAALGALGLAIARRRRT